LIESKIAEIEKETEEETPELSRLYLLRDNVNIGLDMTEEVCNLKRALTRKADYKLAIDEVGESDYDFVSKLYRLFTTEEERCLKTRNERQKKGVIANKIFNTTIAQNMMRKLLLYDLWRNKRCANNAPGQPQHNSRICSVFSGIRHKPFCALNLSSP
jgi:hypothetical protein